MQVKICPKCNAENKLSNESCSSCYGELEDASIREVPDPVVPEAPVSTEPAQDQPPAPPAPVPGPPTAAGPSPYGPPPSAVYTPPSRENMRPTKQGPNIGGIVFLVIVLAAAAFAAWWFLLKPKTPEQVVDAFIAAARAGDVEKVKTCVSLASRAELDESGAAEGLKRSFQKNPSAKESDEEQVKIGETTFEGGSKALVEVMPTDPAAASAVGGMKVQMVLIKEEGQWRIDSKQTQDLMIKRVMEEIKKKGISLPPGALKQMQR